MTFHDEIWEVHTALGWNGKQYNLRMPREDVEKFLTSNQEKRDERKHSPEATVADNSKFMISLYQGYSSSPKDLDAMLQYDMPYLTEVHPTLYVLKEAHRILRIKRDNPGYIPTPQEIILTVRKIKSKTLLDEWGITNIERFLDGKPPAPLDQRLLWSENDEFLEALSPPPKLPELESHLPTKEPPELPKTDLDDDDDDDDDDEED